MKGAKESSPTTSGRHSLPSSGKPTWLSKRTGTRIEGLAASGPTAIDDRRLIEDCGPRLRPKKSKAWTTIESETANSSDSPHAVFEVSVVSDSMAVQAFEFFGLTRFAIGPRSSINRRSLMASGPEAARSSVLTPCPDSGGLPESAIRLNCKAAPQVALDAPGAPFSGWRRGRAGAI